MKQSLAWYHDFMRIFIFLLFLNILPHPSSGEVNYGSFTLPNQMQVVVLPNHREPVISMDLFYKVGSADETLGKTGAAHFLEHMVYKGTKTKSYLDTAVALARLTSYHNASTTDDYTVYTTIFPAQNLEAVLEIQADFMQNLLLDPTEFQKEKSVVLQELLEKLEDDVEGKIAGAVNSQFFFANPYRNPIIGYRQDVEAMTPQDLKNFYHRWYVPNNAILVLAGDITLDKVKALTQKIFGHIPAKTVPKRLSYPEVRPRMGEVFMQFQHPQLQSSLEYIYRVDSIKRDARHRAMLVLLSLIMNNFLRDKLVETQKIATSVSTNPGLSTKDAYSFSIQTDYLATSSPAEITPVLKSYLKELVKNGVTNEDLETAKKNYMNSVYLNRSSISSFSAEIGVALVFGIPLDQMMEQEKLLKSITCKDLHQMIKDIFDQTDVYIILKKYGETVV